MLALVSRARHAVLNLDGVKRYGDLLDLAIEAHNGLSRWRKVRNVSLKLSIGGGLWKLKFTARGDVVDGVSIADKGQEIFDKILAVASGERTKSEVLGYGDAEFAPWQIGATM